MSEIKVHNLRYGGWVFHYAHFLCDLVLPEVINKVYEYDVCYREKSEHQMIGNFKPLWEKIMNTKTIELPEEEFKTLNLPLTTISRFKNVKINGYEKKEIDQFRDYIFKRFNIQRNKSYPPVLLIERGVNKNLINAQDKLQIKTKNKKMLTTGKERREIANIDKLKTFLNENKIPYKCIMLEHMDIEEQIKYFYNAKIIIAAHGAALSNLLFCNEKTSLIEVGGNWAFFNTITKALAIHHVKCENDLSIVIDAFIQEYERWTNKKLNQKIKINLLFQ